MKPSTPAINQNKQKSTVTYASITFQHQLMSTVTLTSYTVSSFIHGMKNSKSSSGLIGTSADIIGLLSVSSSSEKLNNSECTLTFSQSTPWQFLQAVTHSKPCFRHKQSIVLHGFRLEMWHLQRTTFKMLSGATGASVATGMRCWSWSFQPQSVGEASVDIRVFHCNVCRCALRTWNFAAFTVGGRRSGRTMKDLMTSTYLQYCNHDLAVRDFSASKHCRSVIKPFSFDRVAGFDSSCKSILWCTASSYKILSSSKSSGCSVTVQVQHCCADASHA